VSAGYLQLDGFVDPSSFPFNFQKLVGILSQVDKSPRFHTLQMLFIWCLGIMNYGVIYAPEISLLIPPLLVVVSETEEGCNADEWPTFESSIVFLRSSQVLHVGVYPHAMSVSQNL
jgi:hypothetical protein